MTRFACELGDTLESARKLALNQKSSLPQLSRFASRVLTAGLCASHKDDRAAHGQHGM